MIVFTGFSLFLQGYMTLTVYVFYSIIVKLTILTVDESFPLGENLSFLCLRRLTGILYEQADVEDFFSDYKKLYRITLFPALQ